MAITLQIKGSKNWDSSCVLASREIGLELDKNNKPVALKIGDGITRWGNLSEFKPAWLISELSTINGNFSELSGKYLTLINDNLPQLSSIIKNNKDILDNNIKDINNNLTNNILPITNKLSFENNSIKIENTDSSENQLNNINIGFNNVVNKSNNIVLGNNSNTNNNKNSIIVGANAEVNSDNSIQLGSNSKKYSLNIGNLTLVDNGEIPTELITNNIESNTNHKYNISVKNADEAKHCLLADSISTISPFKSDIENISQTVIEKNGIFTNAQEISDGIDKSKNNISIGNDPIKGTNNIANITVGYNIEAGSNSDKNVIIGNGAKVKSNVNSSVQLGEGKLETSNTLKFFDTTIINNDKLNTTLLSNSLENINKELNISAKYVTSKVNECISADIAKNIDGYTVSDISGLIPVYNNTMNGNLQVGKNNKTNSSGVVTIGNVSINPGSNSTNSVAIGGRTENNSMNSVVIGYDAKTTAENSIQLGKGENKTSNSLQIFDFNVVSKELSGENYIFNTNALKNSIKEIPTLEVNNENVSELTYSKIKPSNNSAVIETPLLSSTKIQAKELVISKNGNTTLSSDGSKLTFEVANSNSINNGLELTTNYSDSSGEFTGAWPYPSTNTVMRYVDVKKLLKNTKYIPYASEAGNITQKNNTLEVGTTSQVSEDNSNSIAIGINSLVKPNSKSSLAVGYNASVFGNDSIAIGSNSKTTAENSIQLGQGENTKSNSFKVFSQDIVTNIGDVEQVTFDKNVVKNTFNNNVTNMDDALSISANVLHSISADYLDGNNVQDIITKANEGIHLSSNIDSKSKSYLAVGSTSNDIDNNLSSSVTLGVNNTASNNSLIVGKDNTNSNNSSSIIEGFNNNINSTSDNKISSIIIGCNNKINGNSIVIGNEHNTIDDNSIVIGNISKNNIKSIVLGNNTSDNIVNSNSLYINDNNIIDNIDSKQPSINKAILQNSDVNIVDSVVDYVYTPKTPDGENKTSVSSKIDSLLIGTDISSIGNTSSTSDNSELSDFSQVAIGNNLALIKDGIAIGNKTYATENSIVIGNGVSADSSGCLTVGNNKIKTFNIGDTNILKINNDTVELLPKYINSIVKNTLKTDYNDISSDVAKYSLSSGTASKIDNKPLAAYYDEIVENSNIGKKINLDAGSIIKSTTDGEIILGGQLTSTTNKNDILLTTNTKVDKCNNIIIQDVSHDSSNIGNISEVSNSIFLNANSTLIPSSDTINIGVNNCSNINIGSNSFTEEENTNKCNIVLGNGTINNGVSNSILLGNGKVSTPNTLQVFNTPLLVNNTIPDNLLNDNITRNISAYETDELSPIITYEYDNNNEIIGSTSSTKKIGNFINLSCDNGLDGENNRKYTIISDGVLSSSFLNNSLQLLENSVNKITNTIITTNDEQDNEITSTTYDRGIIINPLAMLKNYTAQADYPANSIIIGNINTSEVTIPEKTNIIALGDIHSNFEIPSSKTFLVENSNESTKSTSITYPINNQFIVNNNLLSYNIVSGGETHYILDSDILSESLKYITLSDVENVATANSAKSAISAEGLINGNSLVKYNDIVDELNNTLKSDIDTLKGNINTLKNDIPTILSSNTSTSSIVCGLDKSSKLLQSENYKNSIFLANSLPSDTQLSDINSVEKSIQIGIGKPKSNTFKVFDYEILDTTTGQISRSSLDGVGSYENNDNVALGSTLSGNINSSDGADVYIGCKESNNKNSIINVGSNIDIPSDSKNNISIGNTIGKFDDKLSSSYNKSSISIGSNISAGINSISIGNNIKNTPDNSIQIGSTEVTYNTVSFGNIPILSGGKLLSNSLKQVPNTSYTQYAYKVGDVVYIYGNWTTEITGTADISSNVSKDVSKTISIDLSSLQITLDNFKKNGSFNSNVYDKKISIFTTPEINSDTTPALVTLVIYNKKINSDKNTLEFNICCYNQGENNANVDIRWCVTILDI